MIPEAEKFFRKIQDTRYPWERGFDVREPSGETNTVWLWHNGVTGEEEQPRFLEETTPQWSFSKGILTMTRDNYNNLLVDGLSIPPPIERELYIPEMIIYSRFHRRTITVEQTSDEIPKGTQHRRLLRESKNPPPQAEQYFTYKGVVKSLDRATIVYAEDLSHWRRQPSGETRLQITRTNKPRK